MSNALQSDLEIIWQTDESDSEFIYARELQKYLGYKNWRAFETTINKAIIACDACGNNSAYHFVLSRKTNLMPKGALKEVQDYKLTRYACYLIAQNGNASNKEVAFSQHYLAVQTRKFEILEQRQKEYAKLKGSKLSLSDEILSTELYQRDVDVQGFLRIQNKVDEAWFGGKNKQGVTLSMPQEDTSDVHEVQLKDLSNKLKKSNDTKVVEPIENHIEESDPLIKTAKQLANHLSKFNIKRKNLQGEKDITEEHIKNHSAMKEVLIKAGVYPKHLLHNKAKELSE